MLEKLNLSTDLVKRGEQLEKLLVETTEELERLKPKAEFYDEVTQSNDWTEMSKTVKSIETACGKKIGRNIMFAFLRDHEILRSGGWNHNEPYQLYVNRGCFRIVETRFRNPVTCETMVGRKTVVSQKGLDFIIKLINEEYGDE